MEVIKTRTVEDVLKDGSPLEWYCGFGRTNLGITGVCYSKAFHEAFGGELTRNFGQWVHIGFVPRVFGIPEGQEEKFTPLIERMHRYAREVFKISGFWPEKIDGKRHALLMLFQGQQTAPFDVMLAGPFS